MHFRKQLVEHVVTKQLVASSNKVISSKIPLPHFAVSRPRNKRGWFPPHTLSTKQLMNEILHISSTSECNSKME